MRGDKSDRFSQLRCPIHAMTESDIREFKDHKESEIRRDLTRIWFERTLAFTISTTHVDEDDTTYTI